MADDGAQSSALLTSTDRDRNIFTHQRPVEPGQVDEDPRLRSSGNGVEGILAAHLRRQDSLGGPAWSARSDIDRLRVVEPVRPASGALSSHPVNTEPGGSSVLTASQPSASVPSERVKIKHETMGTSQPPSIGGLLHGQPPSPDAEQLANNLDRGLDLGTASLDLRLGGACRDVRNGRTPGMRDNSNPSVADLPNTQEPVSNTTVAQGESGADAGSGSFGRRLLTRFSKPLLRRSGHGDATDLPSTPADTNGEATSLAGRGSSCVTSPAMPLWTHSASQDLAQEGGHQRAASDVGMPSSRGRALSSAWASLSASFSRASGPPPTRETSVVQSQPSSNECQPHSSALRKRKSSTPVTKHALKKSGKSSWTLLKKVAKEIRDLRDAYAAVLDQRAPLPRRGMTQHGRPQINAGYISETDSDVGRSMPDNYDRYDDSCDTCGSSSLPRGRPNNDANTSAITDGFGVDNDDLEHSRATSELAIDSDGVETELGKKSLRQRWKSTWRRQQKREQNVIPGS